MKLCLTGGTGLLGGYFAEHAVARGADIVALVRPTSNTRLLDRLGVRHIQGDLRDPASLRAAVAGCDVVVHAASPNGGWKHPSVYAVHTVEGTRNLIEAMAATGTRGLLHISTISVHGLDPIFEPAVSPSGGFGRRFLPHDHYGRAKVAAEKLVAAAHTAGRLQAAVLRPGWLYGPRDTNSYAPLADRVRRGMLLRVGPGHNRLPLVYVENVARAMWEMVPQISSAYQVALYASDGAVTQNDYLASLARAAGITRPPHTVSPRLLLPLVALQEALSARSGYRLPTLLTRHFVYLFGSNWKFEEPLRFNASGNAPPVPFEEGFARTERWYRTTRRR